MARALWKANIRFGDVDVPVRMFSAIQAQGVHFRLLHKKDKVPVEQRMINPVTGDIVPRDRVRKGFEVEPGVFVVLDDLELEALQPEPSRDIRIHRFVESSVMDRRYYERPYFLGPDGDDPAYGALVRALESKNVEGIASWTQRKKSYIGALRVRDEHLLLITLRHAEEVVPIGAIKSPAGRDLDARELKMAEQLISALEGEFDPAAFRDEFRHRVLELVDKKAKGGRIKLHKPVARKPEVRSLADVLEASLAGVKKGKAVA
jgi:DNA end-binding protein Ku